MVTVGSSTYILGGKERNPELYLDSIELFDKQSKYVSRFLNHMTIIWQKYQQKKKNVDVNMQG